VLLIIISLLLCLLHLLRLLRLLRFLRLLGALCLLLLVVKSKVVRKFLQAAVKLRPDFRVSIEFYISLDRS
jgi:hypothetical protein